MLKTLILITILSLIATGIAHSYALNAKTDIFGRTKNHVWTLVFLAGFFTTITLGAFTAGTFIVTVPYEFEKMNNAMEADIKENGFVFGNPFGEDLSVKLDFADQLNELRKITY